MEQFKRENVEVIALSVDPVDKAKEMMVRVNASFPIACGLRVPEDAERVGAYWEERRKIIHATNFILDSERKITQACYSTGPIGRIVAADALRSIATARKRKMLAG